MKSHIRAIRHFALRLKTLYTRLIFNPWRRNVIYIGIPDYYPFNFQEKCFIDILYHHSLKTKAFSVSLDQLSFPFANDSIDSIICDLTIIDKKEHPQLMKELQRILNPQGKLILTYNNYFSLYYRQTREKRSYSSWRIHQLLKKHNFVILKNFYHSFLMKNLPRWFNIWLVRHEPLLKKIFPYLSNKITILAVKETNFYQPLPTQLRLSKKITINTEC
jgi:SAM-dependent methyltransferase